MKHRLLWLIACLLVCLPVAAFASDADAVRRQLEASMVVTGTILVEKDGRVGSYAVDHAGKLPKGVTQLLAKTVPQWEFEPVLVDGRPVRAEAKMRLWVVAHRLGQDSYVIKLRSANFGDGRSRWSWEKSRMRPPEYPMNALMDGIGGTVYLILRIGPDGRVQDAVVEQVNLRAIVSESRLENLRRIFAKSALKAARRWIFVPASDAEPMTAEYELSRVPVDYTLSNQGNAPYGEWSSYVPGPRHVAPWPEAVSLPSPDALGTGGIYTLTQTLHLLTPLG